MLRLTKTKHFIAIWEFFRFSESDAVPKTWSSPVQTGRGWGKWTEKRGKNAREKCFNGFSIDFRNRLLNYFAFFNVRFYFSN